MPRLLLLAPYMDIEELRGKLAKSVQKVIDIHDDHMNPEYKKNYEAFIAGEQHVLMSGYSLTDTLYDVMQSIAGQHYDSQFDTAYNAFVSYFFKSDSYLGI